MALVLTRPHGHARQTVYLVSQSVVEAGAAIVAGQIMEVRPSLPVLSVAFIAAGRLQALAVSRRRVARDVTSVGEQCSAAAAAMAEEMELHDSALAGIEVVAVWGAGGSEAKASRNAKPSI